MKKIIPLLLLTLSLGCKSGQKSEIYKKSAFLMGSIVTITIVDSDEAEALRKIDAALQEISRIEKLMGRTNPASDIYQINQSAGEKPVVVHPETLEILRDAVSITRLTGGGFDITIGALISLWDIDNKAKSLFVPSSEEINKAKSLAGVDHLAINEKNNSILLEKKGIAVDLGGIAQGYGADRATDLLQKAGITGGIVDISGDLRIFGLKPDGSVWRTGIQHPRNPDAILAILQLTDTAVVTSGDYERFFIKDGERYHHILDPSTGFPARDCQSVTIVTDKAVYADALAKSVFVFGPEKGMKLLHDLKEYEGVIVASSGETLVSDGLKGKVELLPNHH